MTKKENKKLTERQELFCKAYVATNSSSKAAEMAGFAMNKSKAHGSKLLNLPHVQSRIAELTQGTHRRLEITAERVLDEIAKIAFVDPTEIFTVNEKGHFTFTGDLRDLNPEERACIAEVTQNITKYGVNTKIKLHDKLSALEKLGKNLKLFTDVQEHKFSVTEMSSVKLVGESEGETIEADFDIGQEPNKLENK